MAQAVADAIGKEKLGVRLAPLTTLMGSQDDTPEATYLAAAISCCLTFFTIRWLGGDALRLLKNRFAIRLLSHLDERPVRSIFLLRCLLQTAPPLNYALAMSGVKFRQYLLGTLLGLPVPITLYCVFFDYLAKALKLAA